MLGDRVLEQKWEPDELNWDRYRIPSPLITMPTNLFSCLGMFSIDNPGSPEDISWMWQARWR
jgi:hypothetical protein